MPTGWIRQGQSLRLLFEHPCLVHWGLDDWQAARDVATVPGALGLHVADLLAEQLNAGWQIVFSVVERETNVWIENDRTVAIIPNEVR